MLKPSEIAKNYCYDLNKTFNKLSFDEICLVELAMSKHKGKSVNGVAGWYHQQRVQFLKETPLMYLCLEASMTGEMKPVIYREQPGKSAAGSHTPRRSKLIKIPEHLQKENIETLSNIYEKELKK